MKKLFLMTLSMVLILSLFACVSEKVNPPEEIINVNAEIIEIKDGKFLVEPIEGEEEREKAERIEVPIEHMSESSPEPKIGDIICISYDGNIFESSPAQLGEVYKISVITEVVEMEVPSDKEEAPKEENFEECEPQSEDVVILNGKSPDDKYLEKEITVYDEIGFLTDGTRTVKAYPDTENGGKIIVDYYTEENESALIEEVLTICKDHGIEKENVEFVKMENNFPINPN